MVLDNENTFNDLWLCIYCSSLIYIHLYQGASILICSRKTSGSPKSVFPFYIRIFHGHTAIQNKDTIFPASPAAKCGHVIKSKPMRYEQTWCMHLTKKGWVMSSIPFSPTAHRNLDIVARTMKIKVTQRCQSNKMEDAWIPDDCGAVRLALDSFPGSGVREK